MGTATNIAPTPTHELRLVFGSARDWARAGADAFPVPVPVLAGPSIHGIELADAVVERIDHFTVFRSATGLAGHWTAPASSDVEAATSDAYRQMLALTRGLHLHRIWNFVPRINAIERGLENYRQFCRARSLAFEKTLGAAFERQLPAASAVGLAEGTFAMAFVAGRVVPEHFENPAQ